MGEDTGLGRNLVALDQLIEGPEEVSRPGRAVGGRVHSDDGIAAAHQKAVDDRRAHSGEIVGRMVGLDPDGETAGQADGVSKRGDDPNFSRHRDQVLVAHQLGHRRNHLGSESRCEDR